MVSFDAAGPYTTPGNNPPLVESEWTKRNTNTKKIKLCFTTQEKSTNKIKMISLDKKLKSATS